MSCPPRIDALYKGLDLLFPFIEPASGQKLSIADFTGCRPPGLSFDRAHHGILGFPELPVGYPFLVDRGNVCSGLLVDVIFRVASVLGLTDV